MKRAPSRGGSRAAPPRPRSHPSRKARAKPALRAAAKPAPKSKPKPTPVTKAPVRAKASPTKPAARAKPSKAAATGAPKATAKQTTAKRATARRLRRFDEGGIAPADGGGASAWTFVSYDPYGNVIQRNRRTGATRVQSTGRHFNPTARLDAGQVEDRRGVPHGEAMGATSSVPFEHRVVEAQEPLDPRRRRYPLPGPPADGGGDQEEYARGGMVPRRRRGG